MTNRYAHLAPEHLREAVAVLDNVVPTWKPSETASVLAQASAQELFATTGGA